MYWAASEAVLTDATWLVETTTVQRANSEMSPMMIWVTSLACTTLRPQCLHERSASAPHQCCVLFAQCTFCTTAPNDLRILRESAQPDVEDEFDVVVVVFCVVVVVLALAPPDFGAPFFEEELGTLNWAFSDTGLIGWATR